jgi:diguanylate cyclase (GGDEF)-like protein
MVELGRGTELSDARALEALVRMDQLATIRRGVLVALPVNSMLGVTITLVASRYGHGAVGVIWFVATSIVNVLRILLCLVPLPPMPSADNSSKDCASGARWGAEKHLHLLWAASLVSGLLWSLLPTLCDGYTTPQAIFYLTVVCGTTAGAVTSGTAYARIPISFITPPLLSVISCLLYAGGFDRNCLAATVVLYLAMLISVSRQGEAGFRVTSRLKNEATTMAKSLKEAHAHSVAIAEQMTHRASHDELTGLFNRAGFIQQVERCTDAGRSVFCLMLLDLDGFKSVNDVFGHTTGDRVLVEVARRLQEALTGEFTIARIGGDEFTVFYELRASDDPPHVLATRLITAIEVPYPAFDAGRLGVSIGIYQAQDVNIAEMLTCADEALYVAKSAGRNRYYLFDENLRDRLAMRCDVERDLQRALFDNALEVWYQPVFGGDGKKLVNFEALLRWKHPKHGWIPPADLVLTAAAAGHSEQLMHFIFREVCAMIQTLCELNIEHVWVAMNVSPREVSRIAIDEFVLERLDDLNLSPHMLEIEITEETAMDIRSVQDKMNRLASAGVRIAVDDFGVGYSSLASLRKLNLKRIKIDRCFVTGITESASDQILVQTILKLGQSLGIEVVAEGVETVEALHMLQKFGCELVQGYYLGYPAPKHEIIGWLQKREVQKTWTSVTEELNVVTGSYKEES